MKTEWNRIVEVRGKGGAAAGLEYFYPGCNHSSFVSLAEIHAHLKGADYPAVQVCPACLDEEIVVEATTKETVQ